MAQSWQTIEQAAVTLRLSVRTVNRHIVAGKLHSRLNEGRREVLVDLPELAGGQSSAANGSPFADQPLPPTDTFSDPTDRKATAGADGATPSNHYSNSGSGAVTVDQETVLALADNAAEKAEMAVTAYQALARLSDTQAQQVRRNARFAWGAVAVMAGITTAAVGVITHRVTRLSAERDNLLSKVAERADEADKLSARGEALRQELAAKESALQADVIAAREEAARTEAKLAAYLEQEKARQSREALAAAMPAVAAPMIPYLSLDPLVTRGIATESGGARAEAEVDNDAREPAASDVAPPVTDARRDESDDATDFDADAELANTEIESDKEAVSARQGGGRTLADERSSDSASDAERVTPGTSAAPRHADTSDASSARAAQRKPAPPTTRRVLSRPKDRAPPPRPATASDTSSASTNEE